MEFTTADITVKVYAVLAWMGAAVMLLFGLGLLLSAPAVAAALAARGNAQGAQLLSGLGWGSALALFVIGALGILVGYGLWRHANWARVLTLVFGVLSLIAFPIGTVFGIITIWLFGFQPDVRSLFGVPDTIFAQEEPSAQ